MGLFNKKNKSSDAAPEVQTQTDAQAPKKKAKGKKRKDTMASILNESVTESAMESFRANTGMRVTRDGETLYIGMLLDANDPSIGGINKKSQRDEDKGQVIELINSGRINTYIPAHFLEEEKMVIIPDAVTLDAMDEFGLMTEANYKLALVHDDGTVEETEYPVSYHDVMSVVVNGTDPMDFLASLGVDWAAGDAGYDEPDMADETASYDGVPFGSDGEDEYDYGDGEDEVYDEPAYDEDAPFSDEDEPAYDDFDEDEPAVAESESDGMDDFDDGFDGSDAEAYDEGGSADIDAESDDEEEAVEEVSEEAVMEAITRKFYSDDLGLEVTTEPFDAQFLHANTYVPFDENRGEGWLNNYLNEMSRAANLEMQHLHRTNLFEMREMFYQLISRHAEQIQHDLDETDPSTLYGQMMDALSAKRLEQEENLNAVVAERRKLIDDEWNKALQQVGEDALRAAQQQYRDRYGKQHDERVFRIEPTVRQEIEDEYQDAVREMRDNRRAEASKRMDYGITESLKEVFDMYSERLKEERSKYEEHRKRIADFLDENRKDDVAHDRALAEELAQSQKADKVMAEYEQKMRVKAAEFDAERQRLSADIEATERRTSERIKEIQQDYDRRLDEMRQEKERLQGQVDDLLKQYAELDAKKEREFGARLAEAKDEARAWSDKCDHIATVHRKSSIVSIVAIVVSIVAALSIGVLVGTNMSLDFGSSKASTAIEQEFSDRMDELEQKQQELTDQTDQTKDDASADADANAKTDASSQTTEQAPAEAQTDGAAAQN